MFLLIQKSDKDIIFSYVPNDLFTNDIESDIIKGLRSRLGDMNFAIYKYNLDSTRSQNTKLQEVLSIKSNEKHYTKGNPSYLADKLNLEDQQVMEDQFVIDYFKGKKGGYLLDIATDWIVSGSLTIKLLDQYEWNGILVEPSDHVVQNETI